MGPRNRTMPATRTCRCGVVAFATVRSRVLLIEQMIDYYSNTGAKKHPERKGSQMTIMHTGESWETSGEFGPDSDRRFRSGSDAAFRHALPREIPPARPNRASASGRPKSRRPAGGAVRYRGTGVRMSRAPHRRSRITPATTVLLALLAGVITVWLGLVAQAGGLVGEHVEAPSRLAVVQVQAGESLQQVAERVAPGVPVAHVVDRIRELNKLESAVLDAGQSLIAPVR